MAHMEGCQGLGCRVGLIVSYCQYWGYQEAIKGGYGGPFASLVSSLI